MWKYGSLFALTLSVLYLGGSANGAELSETSDWKLVWSDEFAGNSLDTAKWTVESGGNPANNELQYYTPGDNIGLHDGHLTITARLQEYGGRHYTSGRLMTKHKAFWTYGRVEARIKLPYGQGMWPAFWMLGENIDQVDWPLCGEIDIMEMVGGIGPKDVKRDALILGSLHRPNLAPGHIISTPKSLTADHGLAGDGRFSDEFHTFAVEWDAAAIRYLVDGHEYEVIDISSNADGFEVFRRPFFIVLNLAVGGDLPGSPDATTVWPQQMVIDWVRVYQKSR